ncbi:hypothetical protein D3C85_1676930 [compost metagenome]
MALDPGQQREHHELDHQLFEGVVVRLLQVVDHGERDLVDPRNVGTSGFENPQYFGIDVVHGDRLEGHALLQQRDLLGVVHAAELLPPLIDNLVDAALILDRRGFARALDHT